MNEDPDQWFRDYINPNTVQLHHIKEVLYSGKATFQSVEIIRTDSFGTCLILDGKIQSCEEDEFIYHEALVHPAMIAHPNPETVFIAGGGEGATLREVLAHLTVKRAVMVDIDKEVVDLCRQFLPSWHQGAFEDHRVELHHQDARKYLAESAKRFDVIIVDLPDPLEEGPAFLLYTQQFYELVKERLTPEGVLSVQAETCSWEDLSGFTAINNTLASVFPLVFPYQVHIPSFGTPWGFSIASLKTDPLSLSPEEVDRRISTRLSKSLCFYDGLAHRGLFSLPKCFRQKLNGAKRIITDDNPLFLPY